MSDQETAVAEATAEEVKPDIENIVLPAVETETEPEAIDDSDVSSATQSEEVEGQESSAEVTEEALEALSILSLQKGQRLTGVVKNITNFGAFIDLGIAQDGLVHISELARRKVENVSEVVSQGQEVEVWVKKVDKKRGRISLTMIRPVTLKMKDIQEEAELEGVITRLESYGAFIDIGSERDGLVHISQITHEYIKHPADVLTPGDFVQVKVLKVNRKKRQIDLSIKALLPPPEPEVKQPVEPIVEVVPEPHVEEVVANEADPMPTAMAIAYAALQHETGEKGAGAMSKGKKKTKKDMDDIIQRTLANREK
jgi:transcriptional accessory protein Tex/SPT6